MIRIENIGKVFNAHSRNRNEVLKGVSFELPEKGFIAIYGKSTGRTAEKYISTAKTLPGKWIRYATQK